MRRRLVNFLLTLVVGYGLALCLIRAFESHFVFFPNTPDRRSGDWNPRGLPVETVWLRTSDGVRLQAWWIESSGARFTFLAFHGNAGNIALRTDVYRFLHTIPVNVLAVEYRGYGRSAGHPSEAGIYKDGDAALQFLEQSKGIDPRTIVAYGQSLGTAVAAYVAASHKVAGVVLEAPFPSASALARKVFWFLPGVSLLVRSQFDTERRLRRIQTPILIVHCTDDPVIPPQMGDAVFADAQPPKFLLKIHGYCHEEASLIDPDRYRTTLRDFLAGLEPSASITVQSHP
jgi:fermentation-respiration switch protein FrsA (DUF1100 family)